MIRRRLPARRPSRRATVARARRARASAPPAGLTIVELLVAMIILAIGLLALASIAVRTSMQVRGGGTQTVASAVAQSRFDGLASTKCSLIANKPVVVGSATTRRIKETWVIQDGNDVVFVTDTVRVPGRTKPLVYLSVIPCRD